MSKLMQKIFNFNQFNREQWVAEKAGEIPVGAKVLDAGAGRGQYRKFFSHCDYKTQDFAKEPGTIGHYAKLDYECDIVDIPVPDESFDVILCTEVLEHVSEPIKVIKEFSRILRGGGGGYLMVYVPHGRSLSMRFMKGNSISAWIPFHLQVFTQRSLRRLLDDAGFDDIRIYEYNPTS